MTDTTRAERLAADMKGFFVEVRLNGRTSIIGALSHDVANQLLSWLQGQITDAAAHAPLLTALYHVGRQLREARAKPRLTIRASLTDPEFAQLCNMLGGYFEQATNVTGDERFSRRIWAEVTQTVGG